MFGDLEVFSSVRDLTSCLSSLFFSISSTILPSTPPILFLSYSKIYFFSSKAMRERERENSFWLVVYSPKKAIMARAGQDPGILFGSPKWVGGAQELGSSSAAFLSVWVQSCIRTREAELQTGVHVGCQYFRQQSRPLPCYADLSFLVFSSQVDT